jgi:hypothetical protein
LEFFVQVLDAPGNLGFSANKGSFFRAFPVGGYLLDPSCTGWCTSPVTVDLAEGVVDATITINGNDGSLPTTFTDEGIYVVTATADGTTSTAEIKIDNSGPVISGPSLNPSYPLNADVTINYSCADSGIGTASCLATVDGEPVSSEGLLPTATVGSFTLIIEAIDKLGNTSTANYDYVVLPVATDDPGETGPYPTGEDTLLSVVAPGVLGNDLPDDGSLSAQVVTSTVNGTLTLNPDGSFTYQPNPDFFGTDSFTYEACVGSFCSPVATVEIIVNEDNDAPVAFDDRYSTDEDTPLTVLLPGVLGNDLDVDDGDILTVASNTSPANGDVTVNPDGSFSYLPDPDFNGIDTFAYEVWDGNGGSATATVEIEVAPVLDVTLHYVGTTLTNASVPVPLRVTVEPDAGEDVDWTIDSYTVRFSSGGALCDAASLKSSRCSPAMNPA